MKINILDIVEGTTVDGPGLRTSIYMAGCRHCCPGCHNPESWAFDGGTAMDLEEILAVVEENDFNVTLSGGDPLYHPTETLELCRQIKQRYGKNIWCYTGFTWEQIVASTTLRPLLDYIDVVVDGPFQLENKQLGLRFKGSTNQRLIAVRPTLTTGKITEWEGL